MGVVPITPDFDETLRQVVIDKIRAKYESTCPAKVANVNGGFTGVLYRFAACAEHDEAFTEHAKIHSVWPPHDQRYFQERHLFEFFVNGQSALECLCYAFFSLGFIADPPTFPMSTDQNLRSISPERTRDNFNSAFPGSLLAVKLGLAVSSTEYKEWKEARNVLSHRTHPGRVLHHVMGGSEHSTWMAFPLDNNTTRARRTWLANQLATLLAECSSFIDTLS